MSLRADCDGIVPPELLPLVPGRFDVVGDIAVLRLPDALVPFAPAIAGAVQRCRKGIRAVVRKCGDVAGDRRVARYEMVAGSGTETVHRENGFAYRLDLGTAFAAPRLASERKRVALMVQPGERVLVPFAGAGFFAIPAAAAGAQVTAVEQNPAAFRFLEENAARNKVAGRMVLVQGDAFDPAVLPEGPFDRAIVPAPYGRDGILRILAPRVRAGGSLHHYTFRKWHEVAGLCEECARLGLTAAGVRRCGNVAPGVSRVAVTFTKDG